MKKIFTALLLCTFIFVNAQKRNVTEPSAEYVAHLKAAKSHKVELIKNKKQLDKFVKNGKLVKIKQRGYGYRIDNLTHSHPFLVPKARTVLDEIGREFVKQTGQNFFVVTSITRTEEDQNRLRTINSNASSNDSSHCFGSAIDISYVRFNQIKGPNSNLEKQLEAVLKKMEKLGKIYFVKERQMKCFHIIIRNY